MNTRDDDTRDRDEMPPHNFNMDFMTQFGIGNREYRNDSRNQMIDYVGP